VARIEIVLGDEVFHATLSEETAPKTAAAVLKALPFEGRAVHAQLSGDMFRMFEHAPIPIEDTENKQAFQAPGEIVYYPPIQEIAIAYGAARFRGTAGFLYLTPLGAVDEHELPRLAKTAERLMWDGSTRIQFRPPADSAAGNHDIRAAAAPRADAARTAGREIELAMDGVTVTASLLDATAPKTAEALWAALPLQGRVTNTKWSGQMLRFWGGDGELGQVPIRLDAPENGQVLHWPGYVYYHPAYRGLRLCYGQAQQSGPTSVSSLTPLARITGDWSAFRTKASAIMFEGAKAMIIRRKER
jgi:hypothetical protein